MELIVIVFFSLSLRVFTCSMISGVGITGSVFGLLATLFFSACVPLRSASQNNHISQYDYMSYRQNTSFNTHCFVYYRYRDLTWHSLVFVAIFFLSMAVGGMADKTRGCGICQVSFILHFLFHQDSIIIFYQVYTSNRYHHSNRSDGSYSLRIMARTIQG